MAARRSTGGGDAGERGAVPCACGGFDLRAALWVQAGRRDRLERLSRPALGPLLAQERPHTTREGEIWPTLRHRRADGTTHLDPLELLERLAALTRRPRVKLTLYYGVLARRVAVRAAAEAASAAPSLDAQS